MQIDWLTVVAQIVNFLVLVWLLQRVLYAPITDAMRRREERIEERLSEARAARKEAEDETRALRQKEDELDASREEILSTARQEAKDLRERLDAEAHKDMEDKRAAWQRHLAEERDALVASIQRQAGKRTLEISERVLSHYADTDTAERVVETFAERLKTVDKDTREKMVEAAAQHDTPAVVQTGTELGSAAKGKITRAIHETLSADLDVDYREARDIVLGVRLTVGDYSVDWSATRYLKRLETEMGEIIDAGFGKTGQGKGKAARNDQDKAKSGTSKKDQETT